MKKTKATLKKKRKEYAIYSWLYLIVGIVFLSVGIYRYFFTDADLGTNLRFLQPVVIDGTLPLILGTLSFSLGTYRVIFGKGAFKMDMEILDEIKEMEEKEREKSRSYPTSYKN
jgi:amino acid transporter